MIDLYALLDHRLIDTSAESMQAYNWIYQPFNFLEGLVWLACVLLCINRYRHRAPARTLALHCLAFLLFALSDFAEIYGTTVLLLLFKAAVLAALVQGHRALTLTPAAANR